MDRRTLSYLAMAIGVLMLIVAFAGRDGVPKETKVLVEMEARQYAEAVDALAGDRREIERALTEEPGLFRSRGYDVTWPQRLDEAEDRLKAAGEDLAAAEALVDDNKKDSVGEIDERLGRARAARAYVLGEATEIVEGARTRLDFKRDLEGNLRRMAEDHRVISHTDLPGLASVVDRAGADWPVKRADLDARLARITDLVSDSDAALMMAEAGGRPTDAADYDRLIEASEALRRNRADVDHAARHLRDLAGQLYTSWERILSDMDIRENGRVTFHQKFDVVRVEITDATERENSVVRESSDWVQVPEADFKRMEGNLGMTVERKREGTYDSEAVKLVEPAGMGYVASPEQGRNQFGYWSHGGGGSFWVFYGQYALLRDLMWGRGGYRPIGTETWRGYDSARRAGRTYYGRDAGGRPTYGSKGTATTTRYASSRYQRSGGFKKTQYKRSGGTYKGSSQASRGRSGGYRRGGSRGGSRFGGGK